MRLIRTVFAVAVSLLLTEAVLAQQVSYTMDDLRSLVNGQSWDELASHLTDIQPAKRDANWQEIVQKAAVGRVRSSLNSTIEDPASAFVILEDFHVKYSFLANSKEWMDLRLATGRMYFEKGLLDSSSYGVQVSNYLIFVRSFPRDPTLAKEAVELVAVIKSQGIELLPFVEHFLAISADKETACSNNRVWPALKQALSQSTESDAAKVAKRLLIEDCWNALDSLALDALSQLGNNSNYSKNTCPALKARGNLGHFQSKVCE